MVFNASILRIAALALAVLALTVGCAGCKPVNFRGQGFPPDETTKTLSSARPADPDNKEKWGFTTKSRQIEDELGIR